MEIMKFSKKKGQIMEVMKLVQHRQHGRTLDILVTKQSRGDFADSSLFKSCLLIPTHYCPPAYIADSPDPIHSKSDKVCGYQIFNLKKSAEKIIAPRIILQILQTQPLSHQCLKTYPPSTVSCQHPIIRLNLEYETRWHQKCLVYSRIWNMKLDNT